MKYFVGKKKIDDKIIELTFDDREDKGWITVWQRITRSFQPTCSNDIISIDGKYFAYSVINFNKKEEAECNFNNIYEQWKKKKSKDILLDLIASK